MTNHDGENISDLFNVSIPQSAANLNLPDPYLLTQYKQLENRTIWVDEQIDEGLIEISKQIMVWNAEDIGIPSGERIPIKVMVFTPGGMDSPTWNLVDTIAASITPVWTINAGVAMSNGLSILVAGHRRFTLPHAVALYHSGSAEVGGTKEQFESASKWIGQQSKVYDEWFMSRVNIDSKLFSRKKKTDWYINADEMVQFGIVDKIITCIDEVM